MRDSLAHIHSRLETIENSQKDVLWQMKQYHVEIATELSRVKHSGIIQLSEKEMVAQLFSGLKIYLDPRDIAVAQQMALDAIWEYRITKAWLKVLKPTDTVMDIGANFGYFGALAAQQTDKKRSKVIFFEANSNLIPYIRKTLAVNWLKEQSIIENLAISDKAGKVSLTVLKDYIGSSSLHTLEHMEGYMDKKMYLEPEEVISVEATTIDAYSAKNNIKSIDLVKMDIEGYEEKAYQGMRKMVQSSPNITLFIEFTKQSYEHPEEFYNQMLKDFGHMYLIDNDSNIIKPSRTDYGSVIGSFDDWVMPIFSKNSKLADG
jgi:FkbM family methyltransferase